MSDIKIIEYEDGRKAFVYKNEETYLKNTIPKIYIEHYPISYEDLPNFISWDLFQDMLKYYIEFNKNN